MNSKSPWQSIRAPWVHVLILREGESPERAVGAPTGFCVTAIQGGKCKTSENLFVELARALSFPDYFGHNWDGVEECLADLEWLPAKGYVLIISDAEQILTKDDEDYPTFIDILNDAGESWSTHQIEGTAQIGTPFHVVLAVSERHKTKRKRWLAPMMASGDLPHRLTSGKVSPIKSRRR